MSIIEENIYKLFKTIIIMVDLKEFKKFFLFNMIGSLIICALVAVVSVLVGSFNEISAKALLTLFMVIVHSFVCLAFIWDDEKRDTSNNLSFFSNVLFGIIILSFLTSILGVWDIINGETVGHLYLTFGVIAFAALHANILAKALDKETYIDVVVYLNYIFILAVVGLLIPVIFVTNSMTALPEMYFRILSAMAIIDGTCTVLTIIFYRWYLHTHPELRVKDSELNAPAKRGWFGFWVWVLIIYLFFQIIVPLFFGFGRFF
jgi:hypothetical protein